MSGAAVALLVAFLVAFGVAAANGAAAAPSPQNGRIFFGTTFVLPPLLANATGGEIYSVNPDGSDLRQLTKGTTGGETGSPEASPDGRTVAYVTTRQGENLSLWLMDADGKHQRRVLSTPGTNYYSPTWAPDGQSLLLTSCDTALDEVDCPIVSVHPDGTGLTTMISNQRVNLSPSYSPDGTRIAYNSDKDGLRGAVYVTSDSGSTRITEPAFGGFLPSWAPDGEHLVLIDHCCQPHSSIYTVRPDGSALTRIVRSPKGWENISPAYSPGGDRLAYSTYPVGAQDDNHLVVADADGRHARTIAEGVHAAEPSWAPQPGTGTTGPAPSVAPQTDIPTMTSTPGAPGLPSTPATDGRILFTDTDRGVIVTANPDGSAPVEVTTTDQGYAPTATWTPDASRIVLTLLPGDSFDREQIHSVSPDGTDLRLVLAEPAGVYAYDPVVTPDGRWIVYTKYNEETDRSAIWAVRLDGTGAHAVIPYAGPTNSTFYGFHALSPDGTTLAYQVQDREGVADTIWVGGFDQRRAKLTGTRIPITTAFQEAFPYSFSRDGRHVLGSQFNEHLGDGAYAFPVDGSTPLQIVQPSYPDQAVDPIQSPSGNKVAYVAKADGISGSGDIVVADRDGSNGQTVSTAVERPLNVQWSTAALQPAGSAARTATPSVSAADRAASRQRLARLRAAVPEPVRQTLGR